MDTLKAVYLQGPCSSRLYIFLKGLYHLLSNSDICYHFKVQLLLIHKLITELEKLWMKQHTLKEVSPSVFFFSFCTTCYKQFAVLLLKSRALRRPSLKVTTMGPQPLWSNNTIFISLQQSGSEKCKYVKNCKATL